MVIAKGQISILSFIGIQSESTFNGFPMKKRMERNSHGGRCGSGSKEEATAEIRKGPWRAEEDEVLVNHVNRYGPRDWSSLRSKGLLQRTGKSCRLRWVNKLRPNLKNGCKFSSEEERIVIDLQAQFGNKWARIATYLPGRTDNDVKNFWSSRQKRSARILRARASENPSSSRAHRKKRESVLPSRDVDPAMEIPKACSANRREDPSGSANQHISVANNGNNAQEHIFCSDVSAPQLGFHFGDENQGFLPSMDFPSFDLVNGGQFSADVSLFQMPGSYSSGPTYEKIIRESYNFLEGLPTDVNDRFEQLPSPSSGGEPNHPHCNPSTQ